ncbi:MAG: OmpA family protein [Treponema sp.]|nr:OmpA family protein [Treponema sp.]
MNKKLIAAGTAAGLVALGSAAFSQKIVRYFSPNNDGIRDALEVPFTAKDKSLIVGWEMVIENEKGDVIRRIGSKSVLPSSIDAKQFFKQIVSAKTGVIIPEKVVWDGTMDDGKTAPDGEYYYYISVTDDSGNNQKTKKFQVTLDNTRPEAKISGPAFNIFGEGDKVTFPVKQTGSKERLWTGTISNAEGKVVKTYKWERSQPENFSWDGTDDKGIIVPDGVYNYSLYSEDRAGNASLPLDIKNIVFSAEKPVTNIAISGTKYFSVPEKSELNKITFNVKIPQPSKGSANKLTAWSVEIVNSAKQVVRTYNQNNSGAVPPEKIIFDGTDALGVRVPEGEYYATVKANYLNGYSTSPINTSLFTFAPNGPEGTIASAANIFSPDGDGNMDTAQFKITKGKNTLAPVKNWTVKIFASGDRTNAVKVYSMGSNLLEKIVWDGIDSNGKICKDGKYIAVLSASDAAGNKLESVLREEITLDTSKTEIMLSASDTGFSPNGDGKHDSIKFTPILKSDANVVKYTFEIQGEKNNAVYTVTQNSKLPAEFVWNGSTTVGAMCPDGKYKAVLKTESANGSQAKIITQDFVLDNSVPAVTTEVPYYTFSLDGESKKNKFVINTTGCTDESLWTAKVLDSANKPVREFSWSGKIGNAVNSSIVWDGKDESGNKAGDGTYTIVINAVDAGYNECTKTIGAVTLDSRPVKVYVTEDYSGISPSSKTGLTQQKFNITASLNEGIDNWQFNVVNEKGQPVYTVSSKESGKTLPAQIVWNGKDKDGKIVEGTFKGELKAVYVKGNEVSETTPSFICSNTAPVLTVVTSPEYFSPDNDGTDDELNIKLGAKTSGKVVSWSFVIKNPEGTGKSGKPFWSVDGQNKITSNLVWNGLSNVSKEKDGTAERVQSAMDYPWEFTVTDDLGLTTVEKGVVHIDILVIREGNVLKMAVPAIIFRANAADFKTAKEAAGSKVTPEQAANNERVLKRVATVLKKFPDYSVTVAGHGNNISGDPEEEKILGPLSLSRAEFVKTRLVKYGVNKNKLSVEGKGGSERIASLEDKDNWWKNRRVEFILNK